MKKLEGKEQQRKENAKNKTVRFMAVLPLWT
jgi:hypothetical protein